MRMRLQPKLALQKVSENLIYMPGFSTLIGANNILALSSLEELIHM